MDGEHLLSEDHDLEDLRDEELVALFVAKRDEEAFNELVNRYGDRVYRLAYRLTGDPKDAEEVLQEVFIILAEKLSSFRSEAKFSTWLYRVAVERGLHVPPELRPLQGQEHKSRRL